MTAILLSKVTGCSYHPYRLSKMLYANRYLRIWRCDKKCTRTNLKYSRRKVWDSEIYGGHINSLAFVPVGVFIFIHANLGVRYIIFGGQTSAGRQFPKFTIGPSIANANIFSQPRRLHHITVAAKWMDAPLQTSGRRLELA